MGAGGRWSVVMGDGRGDGGGWWVVVVADGSHNGGWWMGGRWVVVMRYKWVGVVVVG